MAPELWPLDPAEVDTKYKKRHPAEPVLPNSFIWATWTAAGSDYLQRLDADAPIGGLIDISHVRWATVNAIAAIDLCAAVHAVIGLCCAVSQNGVNQATSNAAIAQSHIRRLRHAANAHETVAQAETAGRPRLTGPAS
jgi:hypothetical protein